MSSKNVKSSKRLTPSKTRKVAIYTVVILGLILLDLSFLGGNIRFYSKWIECGQKPVQIQSWGGSAWYEESPAFQPFLRNQSWFCTPIEAEREGYSATRDKYDFPSLKAVGEPTPFEKKFPENR